MKILRVSKYFEKVYNEFLKDKGELYSRKDNYIYYLVDDSKDVATFLYDNSIIEIEGDKEICIRWLQNNAHKYDIDCDMGRLLVINTETDKTVGVYDFDLDNNWDEKWLNCNGEIKQYDSQDKWTKDVKRLYGLVV